MLQKPRELIMHGGKREGSGRKKTKPETAVIRVKKDLIPIIELLKNAEDDEIRNVVLALQRKDSFTILMDFLEPYK